MTSEIVILITELRNKQRITLPAGAYRFGRSAQCEYVLRRNSVGDHQFTVSYEKDGWVVTDGASDYRTWYNNRYLEPGETSVLQAGDVIGLNTDGNSDTQEITFRVEEITNVQGDGAAPIKEQTTEAVLREVYEETGQDIVIDRVLSLESEHWVGRSMAGTLEDFHALRVIYGATCKTPSDPVVHDVGGSTFRADWVPTRTWRTLNWTNGSRALLSQYARKLSRG